MKLSFTFLSENPRLGLFAVLAIAASGFGQTFFLGVFGGALRDEFGLSNSAYGLSYSLATLVAAGLLLKFGAIVDRISLQRVTLLAVLILASGCLLLGASTNAAFLVLGFLLVRFGGQGMLAHIGITTAARYFERNRGKAMAFTASGFPAAEAMLPALGAMMILWGGWRFTWVASALVLLVLVLPALLYFSRHARHPKTPAQEGAAPQGGMTRAQALRDIGFYRLIPASVAVPFVITALLFHQASLAQAKGWTVDTFAVAFPAFAAGHILSLLYAGPLIDKFSAQRALPFVLVPLVVGLCALGLSEAAWVPWATLGLIGLSQGGVNATVGSIWAERYGVGHVGAIRSVVQSIMVLSTALSPILLGALLDADVDAGVMSLWLAGLAAVAIVLVCRLSAPRADL